MVGSGRDTESVVCEQLQSNNEVVGLRYKGCLDNRTCVTLCHLVNTIATSTA